MERVPLAQFEPALRLRLEELWGQPPNLYKALANHPALVAAWSEFSRTLRHDTRTPRSLRELVILRGASSDRMPGLNGCTRKDRGTCWRKHWRINH
jgi:alkylhydroperoxidase family enzyme